LYGSTGNPLSLTFSSVFPTPDAASLDANNADKDFGSGAVLIVPSGAPTSIVDGTTPAQFVTGAGKSALLYVNYPALGSSYIQSFQIGDTCYCGTSYFTGADGQGHVLTSAGSNGSGFTLMLYNASASGLSFSKSALTQTNPLSGHGDVGVFTTISSNQTQSGTGIIWAATGPDNTSQHGLSLYAFDPVSLATLYNAPAGTWPSTGGNPNTVAVVANGHVYVASKQQLAVFGIGGR